MPTRITWFIYVTASMRYSVYIKMLMKAMKLYIYMCIKETFFSVKVTAIKATISRAFSKQNSKVKTEVETDPNPNRLLWTRTEN